MGTYALLSDKLDEIAPALLKAKTAFGPVLKDKTNPAFKSKYANLEAVLDAVEPALTAQGILILQPTYLNAEDGRMVVRTVLLHTDSGQFFASEWKLNPAKADPQGEGSALTYGRRYSVLTMLGIAPEDDDGNAARKPAEPPAAPVDWLKELAECKTADAVVTLGKRAAQVGEWDKYKTQFHARKAALEEQEKAIQALADGGLISDPKEAPAS